MTTSIRVVEISISKPALVQSIKSSAAIQGKINKAIGLQLLVGWMECRAWKTKGEGIEKEGCQKESLFQWLKELKKS